MIHQQVREVRRRANLVARSVDSGLHTKQSELDILEMLRVTELVIEERLIAGIYTERQKDHKKGYVALFQSIQAQVLETIRGVFTDGETNRASGLVLQKYNTLVLDVLFDALRAVGPERSIKLTKAIVRAVRRDLLSLGEIDEIDATIASTLLANMSKERARKTRRAQTKKQRLAMIAQAAETHAAREREATEN